MLPRHFIFTAFITVTLVLAGCSSSPYRYHVEPTPLKKGQTMYYVNDVSVNLTWNQVMLGKTESGRNTKPGDNRFVNEEVLTQQFRQFLTNHL